MDWWMDWLIDLSKEAQFLSVLEVPFSSFSKWYGARNACTQNGWKSQPRSQGFFLLGTRLSKSSLSSKRVSPQTEIHLDWFKKIYLPLVIGWLIFFVSVLQLLIDCHLGFELQVVRVIKGRYQCRDHYRDSVDQFSLLLVSAPHSPQSKSFSSNWPLHN